MHRTTGPYTQTARDELQRVRAQLASAERACEDAQQRSASLDAANRALNDKLVCVCVRACLIRYLCHESSISDFAL